MSWRKFLSINETSYHIVSVNRYFFSKYLCLFLELCQKYTTFHYYSTMNYLVFAKFATFTSVFNFLVWTMDMINFRLCCLYNIIIEIPNSVCLLLHKTIVGECLQNKMLYLYAKTVFPFSRPEMAREQLKELYFEFRVKKNYVYISHS